MACSVMACSVEELADEKTLDESGLSRTEDTYTEDIQLLADWGYDTTDVQVYDEYYVLSDELVFFKDVLAESRKTPLTKINAYKQKLENDLAKINSEIKRSEGLLNNPNFVAKAPKQKIDLEKEKYESYKRQFEEISEKIKKLS